MYLRDLLPKYLFWPPGARAPVRITTSTGLRAVTGFSRQYCYEAWAGKVPMTKAMATRLHAASRTAIPMDRLFALEPRTWPPAKREALAAARARAKHRLAELLAQAQGAAGRPPACTDATPEGPPPLCGPTNAGSKAPGGSSSGTP